MLLADLPAADKDFSSDVPVSAAYLRRCLSSFAQLALKQDTSVIGPQIHAESAFFNNRFEIPVDNDAAAKYSKYI